MIASSGVLVSVIVPVYNDEGFLAAALSSLRRQDLNSSEFEVIVVDDGSDNPDEIDRVCATSGITAIRVMHQENRGVAEALNAGLALARGRFFSWLSHDDLYLCHKLSSQVAILERYADSKLILFSDYQTIDQSGRLLTTVRLEGALAESGANLLPIERGCINGCTVMMAVEFIRHLGGFDPALHYTQDYDLWLRAYAAGGKFQHQKSATVQTRIHQGQTSRRATGVMRENGQLWQRVADQIAEETLSRSPACTLRRLAALEKFTTRADYFDRLTIEMILDHIRNLKIRAVSHLRVSVVIPTRDRPWATYRALKSVAAQTHENLQVVLVNDAVEPLEDEILQRYLQLGIDLRVVNSGGARGPGAARNLGLGWASGDWIAFLDSDDAYDVDHIFSLLVGLVQTGASLGHTNYMVVHPGGSGSIAETDVHQGFGQDAFLVKYGCRIATPTVMISRTILEPFLSSTFGAAASLFPEDIEVGEDAVAWFRLLNSSGAALWHNPFPGVGVYVSPRSSAANAHSVSDASSSLLEAGHRAGLDVRKSLLRRRAIGQTSSTDGTRPSFRIGGAVVQVTPGQLELYRRSLSLPILGELVHRVVRCLPRG